MPAPNTKLRVQTVTIGILSERTAVNIETIRYYERIGVLPPPPRSTGGHRLYGEPHHRRLVFIRRARELGFSLEDVRALLGLAGGHNLSCSEVRALTRRHIEAIRTKIRDLRKLENTLSDLAARCHGGNVPRCPILETMNTEVRR
jgi:MerR family mercuric resistance operon transcriptional regulator